MLRGRAVLRGPPRARGFLPGLMSGGTRRRTFEQQRVVSHPVDRIFGVVADVGRYDEFLPFCTGSRVVQRGEGTLSTEISVGYGPLVSNFSSRVHLEPLRRVHAVSDPSELLGKPATVLNAVDRTPEPMFRRQSLLRGRAGES